jgi:hypothetical protein
MRARAIEWQSLPRVMLSVVGLAPVQVKRFFGDHAEFSVIK